VKTFSPYDVAAHRRMYPIACIPSRKYSATSRFIGFGRGRGQEQITGTMTNGRTAVVSTTSGEPSVSRTGRGGNCAARSVNLSLADVSRAGVSV